MNQYKTLKMAHGSYDCVEDMSEHDNNCKLEASISPNVTFAH